MMGVGSPDIDLNAYLTQYVSLLGMDNRSWGLSYKGFLQHDGQQKASEEYSFSRGDIIGCLLDLWHGNVTFFINRRALTDPM